MSKSSKKIKRTVGIVTGDSRTGKSAESLRILLNAVKGDKAKGILPQKVIIYDINDEYGDFYLPCLDKKVKIKELKWKDVHSFADQKKAEIRRVRPFTDDGDKSKDYQLTAGYDMLLREFRGGIVYLESFEQIVGNPRDIVSKIKSGALIHKRHDISLIFCLQDDKIANNPTVLGFVDYIRMHGKRYASVPQIKDLNGTDVLLTIARIIVQGQVESDEFDYSTVYPNHLLISGRFFFDDINRAIEKFVRLNVDTYIKNGLFHEPEYMCKAGRNIARIQNDLFRMLRNLINFSCFDDI